MECLVLDFETNTSDHGHEKRGEGMTGDTPVWIYAFACNQDDPEDRLTSNVSDSALAKAMVIANYCFVFIVDQRAEIFNRLWCLYEVYVALTLSSAEGMDSILGVYTYHEHFTSKIWYARNGGKSRVAVGLIDKLHLKRRRSFPLERLLKSFALSIQDATVDKNDDRKHILNAIAGRKDDEMDLYPIQERDHYESSNTTVQKALSRFLFGPPTPSCLSLKQVTTIPKMSKGNFIDINEESTNDIIHTIGQSKIKFLSLSFDKDFEAESKKGFVCFELADEITTVCLSNFRKRDIIALLHMPIVRRLKFLNIELSPHRREVVDAILVLLERTPNRLKGLRILNTCIGGTNNAKECGERLARFFVREDCNFEVLILSGTDLIGSRNIQVWINSIKRNKSLNFLLLRGLSNAVKRKCKRRGNLLCQNDHYSFPGVGGEIYWNGIAFPDATLSREQEKALKTTASSPDSGKTVIVGEFAM